MPARRFTDELRAAADHHWQAQHDHPFVRGLGDGSLDVERFRHFIRQDYLYLIDYGRCFALAAARAPSLDVAARLAELARETFGTEMALHRSFAQEWGVDEAALEAERPTPTTRAYTDFLVRTASMADFPAVASALLPCVWGYAEVGMRLAETGTGTGPYAAWIDLYASTEFVALSDWCRELVDDLAAGAGAGTRGAMRWAFVESSRLELAFWDASWRLEAPV